MAKEPKKKPKPTITVGGVTFDADQVKSATVKIGDRVIAIGDKEDNQKIGFKS